MIDGIADHMGQRVRQFFDHRLVNLGRRALGFDPQCLANLGPRFTRDPRHALEQRFHRLRPDRHDAVLDLSGQGAQFVKPDVDIAALRDLCPFDALRQHGLVDHQFADQIDHPIDPVQFDADGRGHRLGPPFGLFLCRRLFFLRRCRRCRGFRLGRSTRRRRSIGRGPFFDHLGQRDGRDPL